MLKVDEKSMAALRRRNERRVRKVREQMGAKWLAHPTNRVKKLNESREEAASRLTYENQWMPQWLT